MEREIAKKRKYDEREDEDKGGDKPSKKQEVLPGPRDNDTEEKGKIADEIRQMLERCAFVKEGITHRGDYDQDARLKEVVADLTELEEDLQDLQLLMQAMSDEDARERMNGLLERKRKINQKLHHAYQNTAKYPLPVRRGKQDSRKRTNECTIV